jgi:hypothetical protein
MGVGALVVAHRPGNAVGWIFAAIGLLAVTGASAEEYALFASTTRPGALVVRFRRSRGDERLQLKWFTYAAALLPLVFVGDVLPGTASNLLFAAVVAFLPVAVGVAILRYRLYEIDRLINRTLVYGLLTALLAAMYAGPVLLGGQLFGDLGDRPPSWAVAGGEPGRGRPVPAGPAVGAADGGPALQPAALRRRPDRGGLQHPPARAGRSGHPVVGAAGRGGPDRAAHHGVALAAAGRG